VAELEPSFLSDPIETSAQDLRTSFESLTSGVHVPTHQKVTPGAAGLSVDVAAGQAYIQGGSIPDQGLYRCRNDATLNSGAFQLGGIPAAHATLPRFDQIIAHLYDTEADATGLRTWRLEVLAGTPTAGATLANRNGAAALPTNSIRLADIVVPAAAASLGAGDIRDRRGWTRGFHWRTRDSSTPDIAITSTSYVLLDPAMQVRAELGGGILQVMVGIQSMFADVAGREFFCQLRADGATWEGSQGYRQPVDVAGKESNISCLWTRTSTSGSFLIAPYVKVSAGTVTLDVGADYSLYMLVQEIFAGSGDNGLT